MDTVHEPTMNGGFTSGIESGGIFRGSPGTRDLDTVSTAFNRVIKGYHSESRSYLFMLSQA